MNAATLDCGHPPTPDSGCGTGYGTSADGRRWCYDCSHGRELGEILTSGRVFAYHSEADGLHSVTTWPGRVLAPPGKVRLLSRSRDNFGGDRQYLRFEINGLIYSGFSMGPGMYLRARLTTLRSIYA